MALIAALCLLLWTSPVPAQQAVQLNTFPPARADFTAHIEDVRQYLRATQMADRKETDLRFNLPFERQANPKVAYQGQYFLLHGLNDSPSVWWDIADSLAARGFDVRAILLPGHGNTPKAQLNIEYQQWLQVARQQMALFRQANTPFYIGGFSLGGVIASLLALENPDVAGLFLVAPAFYTQKDHLLRWASLVAPFKPWVFGGMIIEDNPAKYNSIPINAMAQYYKTAATLRRQWRGHKFTMPVFMLLSSNDSVVDVPRVRQAFIKRFVHKDKRLLIYSNDKSANNAADNEVIFPSSYPQQRILNQSHMSMMIAPSNPHYGQDGVQLVCNGNEWPVFSACLYYQGQHWYGAHKTPSPDGVPVARVTYNPDFQAMMALHDKVMGIPIGVKK